MTTKIIFNVSFHNTRRRIKRISGKLGPFVFRTYPDGKITAYYKQPWNETESSPERPPVEAGGVASAEEGITCHLPANFDALSKQIREIADQLALVIIAINYQELQ